MESESKLYKDRMTEMPDLERTLQPIVRKISEGFRVLLLNGQRQVGKSTLLSNMSKGTKRGYVSLDNMAARKLAQTDPELFLQQNPPPVIIDEVQYAPSLFPYIKIYADSHRDDKGDGALYPIEIKKTANPGLNDCKSFCSLPKLQKKVGLGAIICLQPERIPLSREVVSIPVWEV
ncbi:hypothetical protein FACS1894167_07240 [Synergistales bacterium]|nr:hypothetical protein FACS1894167_07240 [Synergistales bacterium]